MDYAKFDNLAIHAFKKLFLINYHYNFRNYSEILFNLFNFDDYYEIAINYLIFPNYIKNL